MANRTLRRILSPLVLLLVILFVITVPAKAQQSEAVFAPLFPWDRTKQLAFTGGPHTWRDSAKGSGLDFSSGQTTNPVLAVADGTVVSVGNESCTEGACRTVKVEHEGGWETWYVHLSQYSLRLQNWRDGQRIPVKQGDWIGNEGNHGAIPVHIHIELYRDGEPESWSAVSIDGWQPHYDCAGYEQELNTAQNKAACTSSNYGYYLSKGSIQVLPATKADGYPQKSFASTNRMRGDAYLTQLPNTLIMKPSEQPEITFTLQNISPFDWKIDAQPRISLMHVAGNAGISAEHFNLPQDIPKERELTWSIGIAETLKPGFYQSTWQMAADDVPFGDPVVIVIQVLPEDATVGLVDELKALYDNGRAELESLYHENLDRFYAELDRLQQEAKRRAEEEARRQIERALCGVVPGTMLFALLPLAVRLKRRFRKGDRDGLQ